MKFLSSCYLIVIYLFANGHLGSFKFLDIVNRATMNVGEQVPL